VLHPPEGTDVACFFITGRLAAQADSTAFTEALLEQLAFLAGEQLPASLAPTARDAHRRYLLREAARRAHENGRRLVLVIDGLDEDRSRRPDAAAGEGLPSIASLLPPHPVDGLRVLISGRPNPEIPDDVPGGHPLRRSAVRKLSPSPHASDLERLAKEELRRLLNGSSAERDVIGLATAAQGGLTGKDLQELTGLTPHEIEELMSGVAGRTFARRASRWAPGSRQETYVLGHEELQAASVAFFGGDRLDAFRQRLHAWADGWRRRGWPADTPEYLLGGYGEMLRQEDDGPRLVTLAADNARIDRMLEMTGSDADAIAEVTAAIAAAQRSPDLGDIALLAYRRDHLADRNSGLPPRLPAAWARTGQHHRAEALARSFAGGPRVQALAWTSIALSDAGEQEAARRLMEMACDQLLQIPDQSTRYPAWAGAAAAALARAGEPERAEAMLDGIDDARERDQQLVEVAASMGRAGEALRADAVAASADTVLFKVMALAGAAGGLAVAGQPEQATRFADTAEMLAKSIDDMGTRNAALAAAARALAIAAGPERAEGLVLVLSGPGVQGETAASIAAVLATPERSELAMRLIGAADSLLSDAEAADGDSPSFARQGAANDLAQAFAGAGQPSVAEDLARAGGSTGARVNCLISIAEKLAHVGETAEAVRVLTDAEAVARGGPVLRKRGDALITMARALTAAGAAGQAAELLGDIEAIVTGPLQDEVSLRDLAQALAIAGEAERCAAVADAIGDPPNREYVLAWSAILLANAGEPFHALELAAAVLDPKGRAWAYPPIAAAMAKARHFEQAERLITGLPDAGSRARALTGVAAGRVLAGQGAAALALVNEIQDLQARYRAVADIAPALARRGQAEEALALSDIPDQQIRGQALAGIARSLAETGQADRARQVAETITSLWWRAAALAWVADACTATDAPARAEILTAVDELLAAAKRADDGAQEHLRRDGQENSFLRLPLAERGAACWAASAAFARAGQTERAVHAAGLIPHPKSSRRALEDVAVTLAAAGHAEAAVDLAAAGGFRSPAAAVLARIAAALARAGQRSRARDLLLTAITTGQWESWVSALGDVSMPDLLRLAESARSDFCSALSVRRPDGKPSG
jgi:hypothetical protein